MFWIEPLVLDRGNLVVEVKIGVSLVKQVEQVLIVRHELVFAMRHIHRRDFHIIQVEALDEPSQ